MQVDSFPSPRLTSSETNVALQPRRLHLVPSGTEVDWSSSSSGGGGAGLEGWVGGFIIVADGIVVVNVSLPFTSGPDWESAGFCTLGTVACPPDVGWGAFGFCSVCGPSVHPCMGCSVRSVPGGSKKTSLELPRKTQSPIQDD